MNKIYQLSIVSYLLHLTTDNNCEMYNYSYQLCFPNCEYDHSSVYYSLVKITYINYSINECMK